MGGDWEFRLELGKFEMPVTHSSGDVRQEVRLMKSMAGGINMGVISKQAMGQDHQRKRLDREGVQGQSHGTLQ